jgi:hypothetical protein
MLFGVVVEVRIERHDEASQMLESVVVPSVKASPGFVKAYWLGSDDQSTGTSILIFENEETARDAADAAKAPGGCPGQGHPHRRTSGDRAGLTRRVVRSGPHSGGSSVS